MLAAYTKLLKSNQLSSNPAQQALALKLDALATNLSSTSRQQKVRGLDIHGSVGCGKTYLMDLFASTLPKESAKRLHFHQFMKLIHERIPDYRGQNNYLPVVNI
jgi:cell division protein ZapE